MPLHCTIRPNRTHERHFNARAVARIYCKALSYGVRRVDIEREVVKCSEPEKRPSSEALEALMAAEQSLVQTDAIFEGEIEMLGRINTFVGLVAALARFLVRIPNPAAKAVGGSVLVIKELAESRLKTIVAQKAANDATLAIVRRAAANEAQFLRVVGR